MKKQVSICKAHSLEGNLLLFKNGLYNCSIKLTIKELFIVKHHKTKIKNKKRYNFCKAVNFLQVYKLSSLRLLFLHWNMKLQKKKNFLKIGKLQPLNSFKRLGLRNRPFSKSIQFSTKSIKLNTFSISWKRDRSFSI